MYTHNINDISLSFETTSRVFSPHNADKGTLAMLSLVELTPDDKLLDLGCGYGLVGIYASKFLPHENIVMCDNDANCIQLAKKNAVLNGADGIKIVQSNGFQNIDDTNFSLILSNPPYHADFSVPKHFIEKGFNRLKIGGKMYMVTKRKDWYKNKLTAIFGGVKITEIDGYFIFRAEKRNAKYANKK